MTVNDSATITLPNKWFFRALLGLCAVMVPLGAGLSVLALGAEKWLLGVGIYLAMSLLIAVAAVSYIFERVVSRGDDR